jgi:hypothetical protein
VGGLLNRELGFWHNQGVLQLVKLAGVTVAINEREFVHL